jgi:hypothetical protein
VNIRVRAACSAYALALLVPVGASALAPRNAFESLFGRAPERTGREYTAIQFRSSAGAQWGQTLEDAVTPADTTIPDGLSGGADVGLSANYTRHRGKLLAQGTYGYQEYRGENDFGVPNFNLGARGDFKATTRLVLHGSGRYARVPFFQSVWLPPDFTAALPIERSAILLMQNDNIEATTGVTHNYSKYGSLDLSGTLRQTKFRFSPNSDFSAVGAQVRWNRHVTRDLGVHFGYGREEMRQQSIEGEHRFEYELLDVGVDYARALTLARRTTFSFSTQTALVREALGPRHFRVNGNLMLERRFLRTWVSQMLGQRASVFMPGFRAPVLTDSAQFVLAGYLSRRWLLNINADGTQAEVGFENPQQYATYSGRAKLTFGLTRNFGVFTQYVYSRYQNPPDPQTLFAMPEGIRHGVMIGVQTFISLFDKEQVSRDPR